MTMTVDLAGTCTGPGPCDTSPTGTGNNWVTKAGGLPPYVRALVNAFKRHGVPEQQAVSRAIGVLHDWAAGKGNVTAATRARAAAAIAEWETLRTKAHAHTHDHSRKVASMTVDLTAGDVAAKMMPDADAVKKMAAKVSKMPAALQPRMKRMVAARAHTLKLDLSRPVDLAAVYYPGTTKFPVASQADWLKAWNLRGNSTLPKAAVEKWLIGVARRNGWAVPGAGS